MGQPVGDQITALGWQNDQSAAPAQVIRQACLSPFGSAVPFTVNGEVDLLSLGQSTKPDDNNIRQYSSVGHTTSASVDFHSAARSTIQKVLMDSGASSLAAAENALVAASRRQFYMSNDSILSLDDEMYLSDANEVSTGFQAFLSPSSASLVQAEELLSASHDLISRNRAIPEVNSQTTFATWPDSLHTVPSAPSILTRPTTMRQNLKGSSGTLKASSLVEEDDEDGSSDNDDDAGSIEKKQTTTPIFRIVTRDCPNSNDTNDASDCLPVSIDGTSTLAWVYFGDQLISNSHEIMQLITKSNKLVYPGEEQDSLLELAAALTKIANDRTQEIQPPPVVSQFERLLGQTQVRPSVPRTNMLHSDLSNMTRRIALNGVLQQLALQDEVIESGVYNQTNNPFINSRSTPGSSSASRLFQNHSLAGGQISPTLHGKFGSVPNLSALDAVPPKYYETPAVNWIPEEYKKSEAEL